MEGILFVFFGNSSRELALFDCQMDGENMYIDCCFLKKYLSVSILLRCLGLRKKLSIG